jgi:hypothetical protein
MGSTVGVRFPAEAKIVFHSNLRGSGAHPVSYSVDLSPGSQGLGLDSYYSPPPSVGG